mgnify:CR=1 FL=1
MPSTADDLLRAIEAAYGRLPNFFAEVTAHTQMPVVMYMDVDATLADSVLSPREKQVVLLFLSQYHNSRYDAIVHAHMAQRIGLPPATIDALLADEPLDDERYAALVDATRYSCEQRGWLEPAVLRDLQERGVGKGALYEIFALIGMKTFSGFTHHLADVAVDGPLQETEAQMNTIPTPPDTVRRRRLFLG